MRCAVGAGVTRMPIIHVGWRESCATSSEAGSIRRARTATSTCVSAGVACTRALLTPAVRCVGSCLPPCCRTESADARAPPRCPDPHARSASGTRHAVGRSKRIGNEVGHTQRLTMTTVGSLWPCACSEARSTCLWSASSLLNRAVSGAA